MLSSALSGGPVSLLKFELCVPFILRSGERRSQGAGEEEEEVGGREETERRSPHQKDQQVRHHYFTLNPPSLNGETGVPHLSLQVWQVKDRSSASGEQVRHVKGR